MLINELLRKKSSVFNQSGKCPLWNASSQGSICRAFVWFGRNVRWAFVWSGKCPSGMCLVGKVSIRDVSGRGRIRGEMCVRDVSGNRVG